MKFTSVSFSVGHSFQYFGVFLFSTILQQTNSCEVEFSFVFLAHKKMRKNHQIIQIFLKSSEILFTEIHPVLLKTTISQMSKRWRRHGGGGGRDDLGTCPPQFPKVYKIKKMTIKLFGYTFRRKNYVKIPIGFF